MNDERKDLDDLSSPSPISWPADSSTGQSRLLVDTNRTAGSGRDEQTKTDTPKSSSEDTNTELPEYPTRRLSIRFRTGWTSIIFVASLLVLILAILTAWTLTRIESFVEGRDSLGSRNPQRLSTMFPSLRFNPSLTEEK